MKSASVATPPPSSLDVFRENIFKGKVVFCTGGGSGICKDMTAAMVSPIQFPQIRQTEHASRLAKTWGERGYRWKKVMT